MKNLNKIVDKLLQKNAEAAGVDSIDLYEYEFTHDDMMYIIDEFGRKPTANEWWEAGWTESAVGAMSGQYKATKKVAI